MESKACTTLSDEHFFVSCFSSGGVSVARDDIMYKETDRLRIHIICMYAECERGGGHPVLVLKEIHLDFFFFACENISIFCLVFFSI